MQYSLIVDDEGDIWPEGGAALSRYLRTYRSGAELHEFLMTNLGFIGINPTERRVEISFDPHMVAPKALTSVIYWLNEETFLPTRVFDPSRPDLVSLFATRASLVAHLSDHLLQRKALSTVSRMPIPLEQSAFATRWQAARGICEEVQDTRPRNRLLGELFQGYFSVLRRPQDSGDCVIEHLGDAYAAWEPEFHAHAVGRTFRDIFDKRAGSLVADGYRELCEHSIEPSAESVRALISFPGKPTRRINHDRMILPIGGSQLLIANFVH